MEITRIKIMKNGKISITAVHTENGKSDKNTRESNSKPPEGFTEAVESLKKHVCFIMELVPGDSKKTDITEIHFKRTGKKTQALGAEIHFSRVLATDDSAPTIKAPLKFMDKPAEDTPDLKIYSKEAQNDLKFLIKEAQDYYAGARLDIDMFDEQKEDTPEEK